MTGLLRVDQVAGWLGVHTDTVLRWIHEQRLAAVNVAGSGTRPRWRIERTAVVVFLKARNPDVDLPAHVIPSPARMRPHQSVDAS